jgi:hypothetical protein
MECKRQRVESRGVFRDLIATLHDSLTALLELVAFQADSAARWGTPSTDVGDAHYYGKGYDLIVKSGWREGESAGKLRALPYAGPSFEEDGVGKPRGARAPGETTGIGWDGDDNDYRYCWPIEFLEDVPRPAPSQVTYSAWWRQWDSADVAACVSKVVTEHSWSTHVLTELAQDSGRVHIPGPGSARHVQETQFFGDASCIAKLYRICAVGDVLHSNWRLRHAVDACIDASATDYLSKHDSYQYGAHYSFGLVCAGTAYVCIVRPRISDPDESSPQQLAKWYRARRFVAGVALNHWPQECDIGRDFGRASRYAAGCEPTEPFIQAYINYGQLSHPRSETLRLNLMSTLRRSGLDRVYEFFAAKWRDGVTGFGLSFDAEMFAAAPVCSFCRLPQRYE